MAKRRKEKDEDEDKPFKVPKFDEEAFLKRERRNIKASFIAFLFGLLMAFVCFGFWALMGPSSAFRWPLVLLVCVANAAFIRYIYLRVNLDLEDFAKKNWFFTYAIYFFTWLLIFIVIVNPPFYDDESPLVDVVTLPEMQEPGGDILIAALITDNVQVDQDNILLEVSHEDGNTTSLEYIIYNETTNVVEFRFENPDNLTGEFTFTLSAADTGGHTTTKTGSFIYDDDVIQITNDDDLLDMDANDDIDIEVDERVSKDNFRVYYTLDDGDEINVNRRSVDNKEKYESTPEFEGWEENSNYTMKVYVETSYYFQNIFWVKYSNIVQDTTIYNVSTVEDNDMGEEPPLNAWNWTLAKSQQTNTLNYDTYKDSDNDNKPGSGDVLLPYPYLVEVPGFEAILLIAALAIVVLIFRRKKKDEKK